MPATRKADALGPYYQWGERGHRYRYTAGDKVGRLRAKELAERQGRAIHAQAHNRP
jgi:hypothetical protein